MPLIRNKKKKRKKKDYFFLAIRMNKIKKNKKLRCFCQINKMLIIIKMLINRKLNLCHLLQQVILFNNNKIVSSNKSLKTNNKIYFNNNQIYFHSKINSQIMSLTFRKDLTTKSKIFYNKNSLPKIFLRLIY